jgi:hypothetical protein
LDNCDDPNSTPHKPSRKLKKRGSCSGKKAQTAAENKPTSRQAKAPLTHINNELITDTNYPTPAKAAEAVKAAKAARTKTKQPKKAAQKLQTNRD